ncbi:MAG: extracellular solute-binding protein [Clostridiales bacterium]|nr:extracellular solute-binding protein [Clostridiales bacterium]
MMRKRKWIQLVAVLLLAALLFAGCNQNGGTPGGDNEGKQVVNMLSANYEDQIVLQKAYLQELFPDAEINITYMSSGKLAAKIQAEGGDTEVDIALSLGSSYANQLKEANLLRAYTPPQTKFRAEYADADNMVLPNGVWCGAILVNTTELGKLGLPEPTSYADLIDPMYKGHIVMSNPASSSTGYFFLLGLMNLYGEEAGWDYFDKLSENILLFGESGSVPSSMVEMGECAIGLGMDYEGMALEAAGKPVKTIFAAEGAPYDYDTTLLINRNQEPSEFVLQVMEAITSLEGNAVFNNYNKTVLEGGTDRGNYPASFKLLDMEGITNGDLKSTLLDQWRERYE